MNNQNNKLYSVTIRWWNEYAQDLESEEPVSRFYAFAPNMVDLSQRIEERFKNIESLKIKIINNFCGSDNFFWADETTAKERKHFEMSNDY